MFTVESGPGPGCTEETEAVAVVVPEIGAFVTVSVYVAVATSLKLVPEDG
jgi:hypothetical protein